MSDNNSSFKISSKIKHILKKIPHSPGVYKMKNADGKIIYIGKAKDLYKRVNSYFQKIDKHQVRTRRLVENINDIEYIIAGSELESLIIETNLIKEFRPKYNILLKDDKNFAYIKITVNEDYPRILTVRKVLNDKAKYFGPKTTASRIYSTLKVLRKIFPFRNCNLDIMDLGPNPLANPINPFDSKQNVAVSRATIKYPCLDLHIHRCLAPCVGRPSKEEYAALIHQIINFLEGKYQQVIETLTNDMRRAAQNKRFEQAAKIRDKITAVKNIFENQNASAPDHQNSDIINFYLEEGKAYFNIFQVREGKIIDQQNIILKTEDGIYLGNEKEIPSDGQILLSFLQQFYSENTELPNEIILPVELENQNLVSEWLTVLRGKKVKIHQPERGRKDHLLELSLENARSFAKQSRARWEADLKPNRQVGLENLAQALGLKSIPDRLECFDISHLSGTHTVASMVVFENGLPKPEHYRHFKISIDSPGAPDDFKSMQEVIFRRLKYLKPQTELSAYRISKTSTHTHAKIHPSSPRPTKGDEQKINYQIKKIIKNSLKKIITKVTVSSTSKLKTHFEYFTIPPDDFEPVIKKIIDKFNSRRLYFICTKKELNNFEKLGFQQLREIPPEAKIKRGQLMVVFDKTKHFQDPSFKEIPDLIIIDGGKGQLSSAIKALENYKLEIPIASLAKKQEELFIPGRSNPLSFPENEPARLLLQHLRDEAHRFAIEYNRKLRQNDYNKSSLEEIEGIGRIITKKLLTKFGSLEGIKKASEDEITKIAGRKIAIKIKQTLI